jgi:uncharacterized membrane protein
MGNAVSIRLLARCGLVLLAFCALLSAWPWLGARYGSLLRVSANVALSPLELVYAIEVASAPSTDGVDTILRARRFGSSDRWGTATRSRTVGYLPLATFLSLLVATPLGARRRLAALFAGVALVHLYALVRIGLLFSYALTLHVEHCKAPHAAFLFEAWWRELNHYLLLSLHQEVMLPIAIPVLVWVLVCFRSHDWRALKAWQDRASRTTPRRERPTHCPRPRSLPHRRAAPTRDALSGEAAEPDC